MPEDSNQGAGQGTSSHMMKTTKRGRPFLKVGLPFRWQQRFSLSSDRRIILFFLGYARPLRHLNRFTRPHHA